MMARCSLGLGLSAAGGLVSDPGSGPEGSLADFYPKAGTYDAPSGNTLDDFLTEDSENWSDWNPASIVVGVGMYEIGGNPDPVLANPLGASLISDGFTAVVTFLLETGSFECGVINMPDYDNQVYFAARVAAGQSGIEVDDGIDPDAVPYGTDPAAGIMHKAAFTLTAAGMASMSIDGDPVITSSAGAPLTLNEIVFTGPRVVSRMTFYEPVADSELPALCDLDVAALPASTVSPAITGTAQEGQELTCSDGEWTNGGGVYSKQWYNSGGIRGTGDTYTPNAADAGDIMKCDVFVENATGFAHIVVQSDFIQPA